MIEWRKSDPVNCPECGHNGFVKWFDREQEIRMCTVHKTQTGRPLTWKPVIYAFYEPAGETA